MKQDYFSHPASFCKSGKIPIFAKSKKYYIMGKELHKLGFEGNDASEEYHFSLGFYVFQDKGDYIAYCPALDISTSGNDFNDAVANFYECLQLHFECCIEAGTLYDDLMAHGWKVQKNAVLPPDFSTLMEKQEMRELMDGNIGFEKIVAPAHIPVIFQTHKDPVPEFVVKNAIRNLGVSRKEFIKLLEKL